MKVESLEDQAKDAGLEVWKDKRYKELEFDLFARADGPELLIAYLKDWLKKHPTRPKETTMVHLKDLTLTRHPLGSCAPGLVDPYIPANQHNIAPFGQPRLLKRKADGDESNWPVNQARRLWRRGTSRFKGDCN